jgi:SAM-dependent methyltransferase
VANPERRFTEQWDAVDPFDAEYPHLWIKVEHLGRYLFAANYLKRIQALQVADLGCGSGYGSEIIADSADCVIGVDAESVCSDTISTPSMRASISYYQATLGTGQLSDVITDASMDAAICFETLEHVTDPQRALGEIAEILKPGGTLILSVPNSVAERTDPEGLMSNRFHRRMYSISSISELLTSNGFSVKEVLGQPLAAEVNRNETRLIRRKQTAGRIGDEKVLHSRETIQRLALVIGYPEPRDVERSYSLIIIAQRNSSTERLRD